ncbi:Gem-associated protein 2 [Linum perenne]
MDSDATGFCSVPSQPQQASSSSSLVLAPLSEDQNQRNPDSSSPEKLLTNGDSSSPSSVNGEVEILAVLEAKKKKLLAELEGGAIFNLKGKSFVENVESNGDSSLEVVATVCEDSSGQFKTNENHGADAKKKRSRRKGKDSLKSLEKSEMKVTNQAVEAAIGYGPKYSRQEMEAMRFMNIVEQRNFWRSLYSGLEADIVKEYESLSCSKTQNNNMHRNSDPKQRYGSQTPALNGPKMVAEYSEEEDDSDDDHTSIQRPAFYVEGEPDFDSGPPEDGLEYLRRVRWEAARIPKVKVAKIDKHKINKEQSVYMPQIPDIPKCPDHLLPSKDWEDAFLVDFSQLRLLLARDESSSDNGISQSADNAPFHLLTENNIIPENHNQHPEVSDPTTHVTVDEEDKSVDDASSSSSKAKVNESSENYPTLSAIQGMDSVLRVSTLKKQISLAERASSLSKNECMWLFSMCAAVDTPLLADTSAAIRSLLRKCASLRAAKTELDDEVVMLNILATVCGRFFGQSEY